MVSSLVILYLLQIWHYKELSFAAFFILLYVLLCSLSNNILYMLRFLTGITNSEFVCSKAEQYMPGFVRNLYGKQAVAVVDPPRGGLRKFSHSIVILFKTFQITKFYLQISLHASFTILKTAT